MEKFKDVASLCKAYNSLESEFTKRSQRLRQLEGERDALKAQLDELTSSGAGGASAGESAEEFLKKYPEAYEYLDQLVSVAGEAGEVGLESAYIGLLTEKLKKQAENFSSRDYVLSHIDGSMKDEIIRDYLSGISGAKPGVLLSEGEIAVIPPISPKTLNEAKALAKKLLS